MDNMGLVKWLKSLRLHKYTHLLENFTYDQLLSLHEDYLIEQHVTKGARNKMLVSVKKLSLIPERLMSMPDDLDQEIISMKEALTSLKDILITPIPPLPSAKKRASSTSSTDTDSAYSPDLCSCSSSASSSSSSSSSSPPSYQLTYVFIETLEKVAQRLIESAGFEDNACHGIMAAIVDECSKHNSFTKEQKARVARLRHLTKEQKAKVAGFRQQLRHQQKQQHTKPQHNYSHHYQQQQQQQQQHQLLQQIQNLNLSQQLKNHQQHQFHHNQQQHHYHYDHNNWTGPIQKPLSLSASLLSTTGTTSTIDEEQPTYREYSLLGPGITFELPCLRAANEKHKPASS